MKHRIHVLDEQELQALLNKERPKSYILDSLKILRDNRPHWGCVEHSPPFCNENTNYSVVNSCMCFHHRDAVKDYTAHLKCEAILQRFMEKSFSQPVFVNHLSPVNLETFFNRQWNYSVVRSI